MNDKEECRAAAAECLSAARRTADDSTRASFLLMAQKWLELSRESLGRHRLEVFLDDFNQGQMRPRR
jgi:hypothetical protein